MTRHRQLKRLRDSIKELQAEMHTPSDDAITEWREQQYHKLIETLADIIKKDPEVLMILNTYLDAR